MLFYNQLIWTVVKSTFSKKTIGSLIIAVMTIVLRIHIDGILAILLATEWPTVNFVIHITISTTLVLESQYLYVIVNKFHPEIYQITKYFINNYTNDNFRKWKRISMISICSYLFIYVSIVEISSGMIRQAILEYVVCYIIIDLYEQGFYNKYIQRKHISTETIYDDDKILGQLPNDLSTNESISESINGEFDLSEHISKENKHIISYDDDFDFPLK